MSAVETSITIDDEGWLDEAVLQKLLDDVIEAALHEVPLLGSAATELSVVFSNDDAVRQLNGQWRDKDAATNVLSFPAFPAVSDRLPPMLGDIVLARETIEREATLDGKPFVHHLSHLLAHGLLHLMGYDHMEDAEAEAMEDMERRILARLAIPDPYQ